MSGRDDAIGCAVEVASAGDKSERLLPNGVDLGKLSVVDSELAGLIFLAMLNWWGGAGQWMRGI
jgi:hypothetical protein